MTLFENNWTSIRLVAKSDVFVLTSPPPLRFTLLPLVQMMNESLDYEDEQLMEEDKEGAAMEQKMVAVQGQDGQQYVVLEVIQLQVRDQPDITCTHFIDIPRGVVWLGWLTYSHRKRAKVQITC